MNIIQNDSFARTEELKARADSGSRPLSDEGAVCRLVAAVRVESCQSVDGVSWDCDLFGLRSAPIRTESVESEFRDGVR